MILVMSIEGGHPRGHDVYCGASIAGNC